MFGAGIKFAENIQIDTLFEIHDMEKLLNTLSNEAASKLSNVHELGAIPWKKLLHMCRLDTTQTSDESLVATSSVDIVFSATNDYRQTYRCTQKPAVPIVCISWSYDNTMALYLGKNAFSNIVKTDNGGYRYMNNVSSIEDDNLNSVVAPSINCAQFTRTSNAMIAFGTTRNLVTYDMNKKRVDKVFSMPAPVMWLDLNCDDTFVVVACANGDVYLVELNIPTLPYKHCSFAPTQVTRVRCHHHQSQIFGVTTASGRCAIYNMQPRSPPLFFVAATRNRSTALVDLAFNPIRTRSELAMVDAPGNVCIFNYKSGERLLRFATGIPAFSIDYHSNGKELAAGLADGSIVVLPTSSPYELKVRAQKHHFPVHCLRYTNAPRKSQSDCESVGVVDLH